MNRVLNVDQGHATVHEGEGIFHQVLIAVADSDPLSKPAFQIVETFEFLEVGLVLLVAAGLRNEGQGVEQFAVHVVDVLPPSKGLRFLLPLLVAFVRFERQPCEDAFHELSILFIIEFERVVNRKNHPEPITMPFGLVTLGGVEEELVVLHQFLNGVQTDPLIHVQHDGVKARNDVLLRPVLIAEVVVGPVHSFLLGQDVKLIERHPFFEVVVCPVARIRDNHLVNIRLLKRLSLEELDAVHEGLLDDDMLLVAPCRGEGHHLVPGRVARLIER